MKSIVMILVVALALLPAQLNACTCSKADGPPSEIAVVHSYCNYDRVFIGEAFRVSDVGRDGETKDYYLSIGQDYKGNSEAPVVIRSTDCCSCDAHFELGVPSLIFANESEDEAGYLRASFCSFTGRLQYSKDVVAVLEQLTSAEVDHCSEASLRKWAGITKQREIDEMRLLQRETMELLREITHQQ
jgi:hypothetical protein